MAAVAVPSFIIKACDVLDNPWGVAYLRAVRAGKLLARVLLAREQGARPVVLVGFSLGALVVWECLHEMCRLSETGRARAAGVVQHAVMMGLPASAEAGRWIRLRRVVAGRLINCYRPDDLVLALVHRGTSATSLRAGVAGLSPVKSGDVESFDVSGAGLVTAHHKYRFAMGAVLDHIGIGEVGQ
jgi:pimeloyl-ACP methyl ester carboxylesterase